MQKYFKLKASWELVMTISCHCLQNGIEKYWSTIMYYHAIKLVDEVIVVNTVQQIIQKKLQNKQGQSCQPPLFKMAMVQAMKQGS